MFQEFKLENFENSSKELEKLLDISRNKIEELLKNDLRVRSFVDNVVSKL